MRKCTQLFANGADVPPTTVVPLLLELGRQGASFFDVGPAAKNYKRAIHVAGKLHKTVMSNRISCHVATHSGRVKQVTIESPSHPFTLRRRHLARAAAAPNYPPAPARPFDQGAAPAGGRRACSPRCSPDNVRRPHRRRQDDARGDGGGSHGMAHHSPFIALQAL
jgi:hypothetical protein